MIKLTPKTKPNGHGLGNCHDHFDHPTPPNVKRSHQYSTPPLPVSKVIAFAENFIYNFKGENLKSAIVSMGLTIPQCAYTESRLRTYLAPKVRKVMMGYGQILKLGCGYGNEDGIFFKLSDG